MLWTIVALFLILWLLGFSFGIGGSLIHILLVVALVVFVINLVNARRGAASGQILTMMLRTFSWLAGSRLK